MRCRMSVHAHSIYPCIYTVHKTPLLYLSAEWRLAPLGTRGHLPVPSRARVSQLQGDPQHRQGTQSRDQVESGSVAPGEVMHQFHWQHQNSGQHRVTQPPLVRSSGAPGDAGSLPFVESQKEKNPSGKRAAIPKKMTHSGPVPSRGEGNTLKHRQMFNEPAVVVSKGIPQEVRPGSDQQG